MDTIKHVVEAAETYLWGNDEASNTPSGEEPIAGVQGKGTAADPYDAGNAPRDVALEHVKESAEQAENEEQEGGAAAQERDNRGIIPGFVPGSGSSTTSAGGQAQITEPSKTEPDVAAKDTPTAASMRSETTSMPAPSPSTLETPATSTNAPTATGMPPDTHPPPSLQASTAEAGGSMGSSKGREQHTATTGAAPAGPVSSPQKLNAASARGQPQAQNLPPQEHHVISTGFAAEGGDFDAAEPGAGREADRLLAEHHQEVSHGKKPNALSQQSKPPSVPQHEGNAGSGGGSNQNKTPSQHHTIPHPSFSHLKEKLHKASKHLP
ncbi:hypothetical protein GX51_03418 [Blastomyces parvus]|uniref:Uncharacterized protein n=1 Tax=Blastomyces parvus TaxID=2060905 RepID=A0A2B7X6K2_9EURO|nr:hypothetical protein GX51_03418 [Blastomyces parvus]